jgi:hypothetical protein
MKLLKLTRPPILLIVTSCNNFTFKSTILQHKERIIYRLTVLNGKSWRTRIIRYGFNRKYFTEPLKKVEPQFNLNETAEITNILKCKTTIQFINESLITKP